MQRTMRSLALLLLALSITGCGKKGDSMTGPGDDPLDDPGWFPMPVFDIPSWAPGGGFSPQGQPPFDVNGKGKEHATDVAVPNTNPAHGDRIPFAFGDIRRFVVANVVLLRSQIDLITSSYNNGRPNAAGDVVVIPSYATGMPENERYVALLMNLKAYIQALDDVDVRSRSADDPRTHVVGIAFGNGSGGYVPVEPNTNDPFAGALVWMKATRQQDDAPWWMDQVDWRQGTGTTYASSIRFIIRGDAVVAIIREAELAQIGATQFRWDVFSYTTDPNTDWSHDYTDWIALPSGS